MGIRSAGCINQDSRRFALKNLGATLELKGSLLKRLVLLLAIALVFVPSAVANNGHHHQKPSAPDPSFTCNGVTCTFHVTGLAPLTSYQSSIEYVPSDSSQPGCDTGYGNWETDSTGSYTLTDDETNYIGCGVAPSLPGTVTAWLRSSDSQSFTDPPVLLSDGSSAIVTTTVSS